MTRILRLTLAALLTASFAVSAPAPVAAKADCCAGSCPMPSKKSPAKAGKCCQIAPAQTKDSATLVRLPVVFRPQTVSIVVPARQAVVVPAASAVSPACVFDEAPSGLSPPAVLA